MTALIVLPSYNERENIVLLLKTILALDPSYTVCVVDDNSPDGTAEAIRQFQENELPAGVCT
jgi:dolichol-phosphate mannosyltransferase